jgi:hypothetical protein
MVMIASEGKPRSVDSDKVTTVRPDLVLQGILFIRVYAFSGKNKKMLMYLVFQFLVGPSLDSPVT